MLLTFGIFLFFSYFTKGREDMLISNLINNNYVVATDDSGNEVIVNGVGIGYKKSRGSYIPEGKIQKVYRINSEKTINELTGLIRNIPEDQFLACSEIIDFAQKKLKTELNPNLYVTLTDHVNYAIFRLSKGIQIANPMLSEIKAFYPSEFEVGKYAVTLIQRKLMVDLGEDEAGFIAFHLVNAEANMEMNTTMKVTELVKTSLEMIEEFFKIQIDRDSTNFRRLIAHLQFIASNVLNGTHNLSKPDVFNHIIRTAFPDEMKCSEKIADYIRDHFHYELDDDELVYMAVNISRVRKRRLSERKA